MRSAALAYTLIVITVLSLLLLGLLLLYEIDGLRSNHMKQTYLSLSSMVQIADTIGDHFLDSVIHDQTFEIALNSDTFKVNSVGWGAFHMISMKSMYLDSVETYFMGGSPSLPPDTRIAHMSENKLRICGDIHIEGSHFTQSGDLIAYKNANCDANWLYKRNRIKKFPEIDLRVLDARIKHELKGGFSSMNGKLHLNDTLIDVSWTETPRVIKGDTVWISNSTLKGYVRLKGRVIIIESCVLEDVIISGTDVFCTKAVGSCQFAASQTLQVDSCELDYPTIMYLGGEKGLVDESVVNERLSVSRSEIKGITVLKSEGTRGRLHIGPESKFLGYVYNEGVTQMEGNVSGCIWSHSFQSEVNQAITDNVIAGGKYTSMPNAQYFGWPCAIGTESQVTRIKLVQ